MKAKKILGIVVVALFTILACLVVVSYFVPKNFAFPLETPQTITVYNKDGVGQTIEKTDDRYDEIMKLYNKGFDVKFIEAFFQGKGFDKVTTIADVYKSLSASSLKSTDKIFYIEFGYGSVQETKVVNSNVELTNQQKEYKAVVIEVINSNNLMQVNAYIRDTTSPTQDTGSYVRYVSYARQAKLFNYLTEAFA